MESFFVFTDSRSSGHMITDRETSGLLLKTRPSSGCRASRTVQVHAVLFIQRRQHNLRKLLFPTCYGMVWLVGPLPGGGHQGPAGDTRGRRLCGVWPLTCLWPPSRRRLFAGGGLALHDKEENVARSHRFLAAGLIPVTDAGPQPISSRGLA